MNTLKGEMQRALERLNSASAFPLRLDCQIPGQRVQAELVALDSLACAFQFLGVEIAALAQAPIDELKRAAERLAKRLNYLLEPITAVEVDAQQCAIQMRSNPPHKDDNLTTYYELVVKRGGLISLCRFQKQPGDVRQVVPAQATREVFLRLVDDFSKAS
jgi:hypothetical protein